MQPLSQSALFSPPQTQRPGSRAAETLIILEAQEISVWIFDNKFAAPGTFGQGQVQRGIAQRSGKRINVANTDQRRQQLIAIRDTLLKRTFRNKTKGNPSGIAKDLGVYRWFAAREINRETQHVGEEVERPFDIR